MRISVSIRRLSWPRLKGKNMRARKQSRKQSQSKNNINDEVRFRTQSLEESQQVFDRLLRKEGSNVPPRTLLTNSKRELNYMRPTVAKLEAILRLLTKHQVDHLKVYSLGGALQVFDFNAELGNLISGAREAVHKCEDMIREASEEKRP